MSKIFLSGSRRLSKLNAIFKDKLLDEMKSGAYIIIGDANGADRAIQFFLAEQKYTKVCVFYSGAICRNNIGEWPTKHVPANNLKGRAMYTVKDKEMAAQADQAIVLWDGKSAGSVTNVCEMLERGKQASVYLSSKKSFYEVVSESDLEGLLSDCESEDRTALEASPILKRKLELLNVSSQQTLNF